MGTEFQWVITASDVIITIIIWSLVLSLWLGLFLLLVSKVGNR